MKNKNLTKIFCILVAGFLVISLFGAFTPVIAARENFSEEPVTEEENTLNSELSSLEKAEFLEELETRFRQIKKESEQMKGEWKPDMMDPELMEKVMGEPNTNLGLNSNSGNQLMTDQDTKDQHKVNEAINMGFAGENIKVSLMDTGFDMAQPDIRGKHARFEYNASTMPAYLKQYNGYPLAFDPVSMADYIVSGTTSSVSWWVSMREEVKAVNTTNMGLVAYFSAKPAGDNLYKLPTTLSAGDDVRFGLHPDDAFLSIYGEKPAVLLTQEGGSGPWKNVYVDLDNDRSFRDETPAYLNGTARDSEVIAQDIDGDGIGDISGGMVTFISNENESGMNMPIPYSQSYRRTMNTLMSLKLGWLPGDFEALAGVDAWDYFVGNGTPGSGPYYDKPSPGDLVCLMGDFNGPGSMGAHGTWTASAVVGQGVTGTPGSSVPPDPDGGEGIVQGMAPNATIIPMGHFFESPPNILSAFDAAYASMIFTTEGFDGNVSTYDDQAQIASSSFGNSYPTNVGGFNYYDRLMDYAANQHSQGNTLFVNSEGNEGSGFATMGAPAGAQAILSVGASTNMYYRVDEWHAYDGGPNPWYGDVPSMSSRGPDCIGGHSVDILTNGQFGYGGDPLNNHAYSLGHFQGNNSWYLWSGTSLSAPNAASIAALVYQAYWETHGVRPTAQQVKEFVMQGADNLKNSAFIQGPGIANAEKAVKLAIKADGLMVPNTHEWRPGMNPETMTSTEHNVNMMYPGDTVQDKFKLQNRNATHNVNYSMEAVHLEKVGENHIELESGTTDLSPYGYPYGTGPQPILVINETGMWYPNGTYAGSLDHTDADLVRFGIHTPYSEIKMMDPAFGIQRQAFLEFHDWTDVNGNGSYDGFYERNRIGYIWIASGSYGPDQTSSYMELSDLGSRLHDGLALRARPLYVAPEVFGGGPIPFTLTIEHFNETTWDWVSIDNSTGTIPADSGVGFNLTATVPSDAPVGLYEGKIKVTNTDKDIDSIIPTTITVGKSYNVSESATLHYEFGAGSGNFSHETGIYRNDRVYGSWSGAYPRSGDWRYFYFNLSGPTDGPVALNLNYDDPVSKVEAYLLSSPSVTPSGSDYIDAFSWYYPSRYGMYQLEVHSSTDNYSGEFGFVTEDELTAGTYMVAVHSKQISGDMDYQEFSGEIYIPGTATPTSHDLTYNIASQSDATSMTSGSLETMVQAGTDYTSITSHVTGPLRSDETTYMGTTNPPNSGWGKTYFVNYAVHVEVECKGVQRLILDLSSPATDLDMGLLLDDGDGVPDMGDTLVADSGTSGSDEYIELENPADGLYFAAVNTYSGSAGEDFTLEIQKFYSVDGSFGVESLPSSLSDGQVYVANITYDLPNIAGTYSGSVSIGKPDSSIGIMIPISVTLNDQLPGTLTLNDTMSTTMITEPSHSLVFDYNDPYFYSSMDPTTAQIYMDGMAVPSDALMVDTINDRITLIDPYSNVEDGTYSVEAMVEDMYGNMMSSSSVMVTIDHDVIPFTTTMKHGSTTIMPGDETGAEMITVEGTTQVWTTGEKSEVYVNSEEVTVNNDGTFSTMVQLSHGYNMINIVSINPFGTEVERNYVVHADHMTELSVDDMPSLVATENITVSGTTEKGATVTVNGESVTVHTDGTFSGMISLSEGENTLTIIATDDYDNTKTVVKTVTSDMTAPSISGVTAPSETTTATATVTGSVDDAHADVWVNGISASSAGTTTFSATVNLVEGDNTVTIMAEDDAGNVATHSVSITYTPNYATNDDITDVNDRISDVDNKIDDVNSDLLAELDDTESGLMDEIDSVNSGLSDQIDGTESSLSDAIDSVSSDLSDTETNLNERIDTLEQNNEDLRSQIMMYGLAGIIILIIGLAVVAWMISKKSGGTTETTTEPETYEEEEFFEEEETEEEL